MKAGNGLVEWLVQRMLTKKRFRPPPNEKSSPGVGLHQVSKPPHHIHMCTLTNVCIFNGEVIYNNLILVKKENTYILF